MMFLQMFKLHKNFFPNNFRLSQGLNSEENQGDTAASRGEMYFSELDEKQIDNLYEMYSFDLELFDYKVEKYIFNKN